MNPTLELSILIWFSFLYRCQTVYLPISAPVDYNELSSGYSRTFASALPKKHQQSLFNTLQALSLEQQKSLYTDLQRQQREFELSRSKWTRTRDAIPPSDDEEDIEKLQSTIGFGSVPVVRNKRTLTFLVKSLAEILALRLTLFKYQVVLPAVANGIIGQPAPPPASAGSSPAPAAPSPAPRQPPPPRQRPTAPPKRPPVVPSVQPTKPTIPAAPSTPARAQPSLPPTIPPNQIDPNTIRYPFRPAPTIPFLTFASLPPGVTVPYPPLFQWPNTTTQQVPTAPPPGALPQTPCVGMSPAARPNPSPPSRLPLPQPRKPVPPPRIPPTTNPVKSSYSDDEPFRYEIFNNVKSILPASGITYSGDPSYKDKSRKYEPSSEHTEEPTSPYDTEKYREETTKYDYKVFSFGGLSDEVPTEESLQAINEEFDRDTTHNDNVFHSLEFLNDDYETTTQSSNYYDNDGGTKITSSDDVDEQRAETLKPYSDYYMGGMDDFEETTKYNRFVTKVYHEDYPEPAEETRAVKIKNKSQSSDKISDPVKRVPNYRKRKKSTSWNNGQANKPISKSITRSANKFKANHKKAKFNNYKPNKIPLRSKYSRTDRNVSGDSGRQKNKKDFLIVVPNRRKRDIFFDAAFEKFNHSLMNDFFKNPIRKQGEEVAQFIEINGALTPHETYRKKLEKDLEHYVESYVEQQITKGNIDVSKPKTTIIELKTKSGPPIKMVTTTVSRLIDGGQPLVDSILEFSKSINPVSNIADVGSGVAEHYGEHADQSEMVEDFEEATVSDETPTSWSVTNSDNF